MKTLVRVHCPGEYAKGPAQRIAPTFIALISMIAVLHAALYILSPLRPTSAIDYALVLTAVYLIVLFGALTAFSTIFARSMLPTGAPEIQSAISSKILLLLLAVSAVGVASHLYAKSGLFSQFDGPCITEIRNAWITADRGARSSLQVITSELGYLFSGAIGVGLFFVGLRWQSMGRYSRYGLLFAFVGLSIAFSAPILSRSSLLTFLMCLFLGLFYQILLRQDISIALRQSAVPFLIAAIVFMAASGSIFRSNILCTSQRTQQDQDRAAFQPQNTGKATALPEMGERYISGFTDELNVNLKSGSKPLYDRCPSCAMMAVYLTHGFFNFVTSTGYNERAQRPLTGFFTVYLARLGLISPDNEQVKRAYGRGGISLPGAAWYEFGLAGIVILALLHGVGLAAAGALVQTRKLILQAVGLLLYLHFGLLTLWMFVLPVMPTLAYPFLALASFVTIGAIGIRPPLRKALSSSPKKSIS